MIAPDMDSHGGEKSPARGSKKEFDKKEEEKKKYSYPVQLPPGYEKFARIINKHIIDIQKECNYLRTELSKAKDKLARVDNVLEANDLKKMKDVRKIAEGLVVNSPENGWAKCK